MSVTTVELQSSDFLYCGGSSSDPFQSVFHIDDVSVEALFPGFSFDHVESDEADQLLPFELELSHQASEFSAQPTSMDKFNKTAVASIAGASDVSDVAPNVLTSAGLVDAEASPVGKNKGRKRRIPTSRKLSHRNVGQSRLNMISELESGLPSQLLKRLRKESKEHFSAEEEKINIIVKYLNNKKKHPLVKKHGVKKLANYIVNDFSFRVSGVERGSFQSIKAHAMKSYSVQKRRKIDNTYLELLKWANNQQAISGLDSADQSGVVCPSGFFSGVVSGAVESALANYK